MCAAGADAGGAVGGRAILQGHIARAVDGGDVAAGCVMCGNAGAACAYFNVAAVAAACACCYQYAGGIGAGKRNITGVGQMCAVAGNVAGDVVQAGSEVCCAYQ